MKNLQDPNDKLDAQFTQIWKAYEDHLAGRGVLDDRIRRLAIIGMCATMGEEQELEGQIRTGLDAKIAPLEMLEAVLQARVYVGKPRTDRALKRVFAVYAELKVPIAEMTRGIDPRAWRAERNVEQERTRWLASGEEFPQRDALIEKYGWEGMSIGMMMQPVNFPSVISKCDALDPVYAKAWIDVTHAGMYARPVLSQQDRTLIMIGDVVSIGEFTQARFHMGNAVRLGIPPRQVLEICWLTTLYAGMPKLYSAFMFKDVLGELGVALN